MKKLLCLAALCLLAGCGEVEMAHEEAAMMEPAPAFAPQADYAAGSDAASGRKMAQPAAPEGESEPVGGRMLAYEYSAELQVPAARVSPVMKAHMAACESAGAAICQIIASNQGGSGEDWGWASLEMRAARDWMSDFRTGLEGDAQAANGKLASSSMRAEDLTRTITDMTARLEAQKTLRGRLLLLLEKDTDQVGDLLQIERELARVQGEIESAESYLRVLQARVSMDRMNLSYQTLPQAVSSSTFDSLGHAFKRFFGVLADSLATMVLFFAAILPWLIIAVPALWLLVRVIRGLFKRRKTA
ncbi:DUF4349 domain-containing protein [Aquisalinus flavus]|uniref:DUF4349 domain-containing protein n=1 Tax=Aquisalinus flavus TaxID=1526572 RepID=A0A8J2V5E0_9PROT|nr:DUF4349 domain-containing protein [Aquisalinus flavus]MBD0426554.1 DUF4349 domain-containing protein [Aquisalinus flavus]UNE47897.1 DUF4349 domain-containing protein [Aquisalinus flavus]GGD07037.1 hypothetical protein GCM10011342_14800 [Aquisalinus flavus]